MGFLIGKVLGGQSVWLHEEGTTAIFDGGEVHLLRRVRREVLTIVCEDNDSKYFSSARGGATGVIF